MRKVLFELLIIAASVIAISCTSKECADFAAKAYYWGITLETCDEAHLETTVTFDESTIPEVSNKGRSIVHTYKDVDGKNIEVSFTFTTYEGGKKGVEIVTSVKNNEKGIFVKAVSGPIYADKSIKLDEGSIYIPVAAGLRLSGFPDQKLKNNEPKALKKGRWQWDAGENCFVINCPCPSPFMSMQYWEYVSGQYGLYVATHDPECRYKNFFIKYFPDEDIVSYGIEHMMTCFEGQTYSSPSVIICEIGSDWHEGADIYSDFYHSNFKPVQKPVWMSSSTAWMLTILKQQNGEIMWPYKSIGEEMTDAALARGFNIIGLFGWTEGGHDKWYPEYNPDPAMGGEEALKSGIAKAHERGMKVIIYVNGQLIDTEGTSFWPECGDSIVVRKSDGTDYHQMWQKYKDCPARHHGMVCQSTEIWKEIMLKLARQAASYGADGIIYDQLGTQNVSFCYASNHGHSVPHIVYERDKYANLKYVQESMAADNPEFIVITEGICDAEINSVDMFHLAGSFCMNMFTTPAKVKGYLEGGPAGEYFSQMFKYTIPEWISTDRNQSPVINRMQLNYDVLCGIRPEMEARYMPDRQYLLDGRQSRDDDYENMVSKVDISEIKNLDAVASATYMRQINEFLLNNGDLFFAGKFVDTKGYVISSESKDIRSSAFVNGGKMGVVVWNASNDAPATYTISAEGYQLKSTLSPETDTCVAGELAPQSLQLVIFEK